MLIIGTCYFFFIFSGDGHAGAQAAEATAQHFPQPPLTLKNRLAWAAEHPLLPNTITFFEELPKGQFIYSPQTFPDKFTAGMQAYGDSRGQIALAVCPDTKNLITGEYTGSVYRVYPCRPILHAELINPLFNDQSVYTAGKEIMRFIPNAAGAAPYDLINFVEMPNNPYG